jgi:hypothetical protein
MVHFPESACIVDNEYSFVHAVGQGNYICSILLPYTLLGERIYILSWVKAEFELNAHNLTCLIHHFLLSFLETAFPFLCVPSAAALLRAPGLTLPARPARWSPGS